MTRQPFPQSSELAALAVGANAHLQTWRKGFPFRHATTEPRRDEAQFLFFVRVVTLTGEETWLLLLPAPLLLSALAFEALCFCFLSVFSVFFRFPLCLPTCLLLLHRLGRVRYFVLNKYGPSIHEGAVGSLSLFGPGSLAHAATSLDSTRMKSVLGRPVWPVQLPPCRRPPFLSISTSSLQVRWWPLRCRASKSLCSRLPVPVIALPLLRRPSTDSSICQEPLCRLFLPVSRSSILLIPMEWPRMVIAF